MISLFLLVSMTTRGMQLDQDTAWEWGFFCFFFFIFPFNTTILRTFAVYSDNQTKEKNGHFQYLGNFTIFISSKVILLSLLFTSTMTCPLKDQVYDLVSTMIVLPSLNLELGRAVFEFCFSQLTVVEPWESFLIFLIYMSLFIK